MASYSLTIMPGNAKLAADIQVYLERAVASDTLTIDCTKGGDSLVKEALTVLSAPQLKKKYQRAAVDNKNRHCVVVIF